MLDHPICHEHQNALNAAGWFDVAWRVCRAGGSALVFAMCTLLSGCDDFLTKDVVIGGGKNSRDGDDGDGGTGDIDDDADGLSNQVEEAFDTKATVADSDHDGFSDGVEFVVDSGDPLDARETPDGLDRERILNPSEAITDSIDSDDDGLGDNFEEENGLDPDDSDTDNDGYRDGLELVANSDPFLSTSRPERDSPPSSDGITRSGNGPADADDDGLSNDFESLNGTLVNTRDTDRDGFDDGLEFLMGSDPTNRLSVPAFRVPPPPQGLDSGDS